MCKYQCFTSFHTILLPVEFCDGSEYWAGCCYREVRMLSSLDMSKSERSAGPESWLYYKERIWRMTKEPLLSGMEPHRLLWLLRRLINLHDQRDGIGPVSLVFVSLRTWRKEKLRIWELSYPWSCMPASTRHQRSDSLPTPVARNANPVTEGRIGVELRMPRASSIAWS